ncbi:sulfurtransferase complex subunit TusB [Celerinatantimonas yamalensis]|uniref:Sulfurtransferase complex subunit TusB n=1 Tax=Celerinatantimonas yamalensis TaxID=559956 RepID=A0ABW9G7E2_9GAMM
MLHIYRDCQFPSQQLTQCLAMLTCDDHLLLIENGVYLVCYQHPELLALAQTNRLSVLTDDLDARGVQAPALYPTISMSQWVALSAQHVNSLTWAVSSSV